MSSADIEYHIKFPINSFGAEEDNSFVKIGNDEKAPVVFLLGWIGCRDKNLSRYSEVYSEMG